MKRARRRTPALGARVALGILPLLTLYPLAVSCRPQPPAIALSTANDQLAGASEFLVLPSGDWEVEDDAIAPNWPGAAMLRVRDRRAVRENLTVRFRPLKPLPGTLRVIWDGERLDVISAQPDGAVEYTIPAERISGDHLLALRWKGDAPGRPAFAEVSWFSGELAGRIGPADLRHSSRLDGFLGQGVAGSGSTYGGGLLVVGGTTPRLRVDASRGGTFRCEVVNLEGPGAAFSIVRPGPLGGRELWQRRLERGERAAVAVDVATGDVLELRRRGSDRRSLALWGQPRLTPDRVAPRLIVLLTLDTTRRDALGVYGRPGGWTPNLDRLAATATVYERAYSTTSWTLPAHASIFTGLLPREHGAGVTELALPARHPTLASLLAPSFRTAGLVGGPLLRPTYGVGRGFGTFRVPAEVEVAGRELTRQAIELLRASADEPLFLFVNYFDPHYPFRAPADLPASAPARQAAAAIAPESTGGRILAGSEVLWLEVIERRQTLEPDAIRAFELAYLAEVSEMDRRIGELLDFLRAEGRFDDALIIAAADHGEMLGERGLFSHGVRLEPELTDIPMMVKFPRQTEAARVSEPVSLVDLFPTVLGAAGLDAPPREAVALWKLDPLGRRRWVQFEEHESEVHPFYAAIRLGPHLVGAQGRDGRAVRWDGGEECWQSTRGGSRKIGCDDAAVAELRDEIARIELAPKRRPGASPAALDAEERRRLRALGYL